MLLTSLGTFAQSSITIKGQVVDETTSEPLSGFQSLKKGQIMESLPTLTVISVSRLPSIQLLQFLTSGMLLKKFQSTM